MALKLRLQRGSDLTLDHERLTIVRKFEVIGTLPFSGGGDAFDVVASQAIALIMAGGVDENGHAFGPTYQTPMGRLFWNSIQLHERFYAQNYDISVTYSPVNRATGAYQITVDQAVGNVHVTAGRRIAGYDADGVAADPDNEGVMFDGLEVTGTEIPDAEDRITIAYRHPQAFLNHAYIRAVGKLRGYPNKDKFLDYEPGEVRYMGGNYGQTDCEASASYTFDISPNVEDLEVGGITIASKTGFDVVSPIYEALEKNGEAVREVKAIEIIRFREWKDYVPIFGWGG